MHVSIIAPPTPVIVPSTLALPAALCKFNFFVTREIKKEC